ncbi:hypothetical protein GCM10009544_18420 [Streptomyces stramineus]|uniref:Uncharacterized protein n=1 Tax=Streptomyces stramineus TaxID=173861 RepID=A0ABP3JLX7_9ACTN
MSVAEYFPPIPEAPAAQCCKCLRATSAPVAVRYVETGSGPGIPLYACPHCAPSVPAGPHWDDVIRNP